MPFLTPDELKSAIYEYQVDDITDGDDTIVLEAIEAATDEVASYFTPNNQLANYDGRVLYDTDKIFAATGTDRNALILMHVKTVAKWWIILLSNVDILYEQVKDRYDRSIDYLTKIMNGEVTINSLPKLDPPTDPDNPDGPDAFSFGSRRKFGHDVEGWNDEDFYFSQNKPV